MPTIGDLATCVTSTNAGPLLLALDLVCPSILCRIQMLET